MLELSPSLLLIGAAALGIFVSQHGFANPRFTLATYSADIEFDESRNQYCIARI